MEYNIRLYKSGLKAVKAEKKFQIRGFDVFWYHDKDRGCWVLSEYQSGGQIAVCPTRAYKNNCEVNFGNRVDSCGVESMLKSLSACLYNNGVANEQP